MAIIKSMMQFEKMFNVEVPHIVVDASGVWSLVVLILKAAIQYWISDESDTIWFAFDW